MNPHNGGFLTGRMVRDPEVRGPATTFTLAVDEWNSQTKQKEAQFIRAVAFGRSGDTIQQYAGQGREISITYKLRVNQWTTQQGEKRTELSVVVDEVKLGRAAQNTTGMPANAPQQQRQQPAWAGGSGGRPQGGWDTTNGGGDPYAQDGGPGGPGDDADPFGFGGQ